MSETPPLTAGELDVLRGLQRKKDGAQPPFVNIRDARALTGLGYADRTRDGWEITPLGLARLALEPEPQSPAPHLLQMVPSSRDGDGDGQASPPALLEQWRALRILLLDQLGAVASDGQVWSAIAEFDAAIAADTEGPG